jgi:hypothetical protein
MGSTGTSAVGQISSAIGFSRESSGDWGTQLRFYTHSTSTSDLDELNEAMRIDSNGTLAVGTTDTHSWTVFDGRVRVGARGCLATTTASTQVIHNAYFDGAYKRIGGTDYATRYYQTDGTHVWDTAASGAANSTISFSEAMRIDSSGNLLVGSTNAAPASNNVDGVSLRINNSSQFSRTDGGAVMINRKTSDGELMRLAKDGSGIGAIGIYSGDLYVANQPFDGAGAGLRYNSGFPNILPCNGLGADRDNAIDLGSSVVRFDDVYATNGTIQTSDRNEKQDIEELTDAEQRVAVAAKGLLRKFRWKDKVAEKGDKARTHFGIIAQDLQAAFEAEGLDAGDYAMFISSTWTDEETGEERTRMGVRYSELLAFIIAAI